MRFLDTVDSLRQKALDRASWQQHLTHRYLLWRQPEKAERGIALLASYMNNKAEDEALDDYLDAKVFAGQKGTKMDPDPKDVEGYNTFIERFKKTLPIMKAATETMK